MHKNKWIITIVIGIIAVAVYFAFPLDKKINLGLDLQGGIHLVLEVDETKLPEGTKLRDAVERAIEIIRNRIDALGCCRTNNTKTGRKNG